MASSADERSRPSAATSDCASLALASSCSSAGGSISGRTRQHADSPGRGTPSATARAATLAWIFLPLLVAAPFALVSARCRRALLGLLVRTLARAGPCATKLGQWASTRPDLLPRSVCSALSELHEGVTTHSFADTRRVCLRALGPDACAQLESLSAEPIGSGCIAQVHAASLADGTRVAVKVLHPHAERTVVVDLALIRLAVRLVEALVPLGGLRWLAMRGASEEFESFMLLQLDLRVEAANLRRFAANFEEQPVWSGGVGLFGFGGRSEEARVLFPRPIEGMVSREVLVETFSDGTSLSALLAPPPSSSSASSSSSSSVASSLVGRSRLRFSSSSQAAVAAEREHADRGSGGGGRDGGGDGGGDDGGSQLLTDQRKKRLARAGLRTFLQMMLVHNFVHADLHPGNILCRFSRAGDDGPGGDQPAGGDRPAGGDQSAGGDRSAGVGHAGTGGERAGGASTRSRGGGSGGEHLSLTFIDAGLTVQLSARDRLNFLRLFDAIAHGDGKRAGRLMLEHAREAECDDPDVFVAKIDRLVQQSHAARRGEFTLSRVDVGKVLLDVLSAVREHRVMIEPNFTTLVSSICILEGLGRQLDPELDLFTLALPMLGRLALSEAFSARDKS
jgi:aarF domain-containing kinase